jgi:hypothetical protein
MVSQCFPKLFNITCFYSRSSQGTSFSENILFENVALSYILYPDYIFRVDYHMHPAFKHKMKSNLLQKTFIKYQRGKKHSNYHFIICLIAPHVKHFVVLLDYELNMN